MDGATISVRNVESVLKTGRNDGAKLPKKSLSLGRSSSCGADDDAAGECA
jgi:hypothetical protein